MRRRSIPFIAVIAAALAVPGAVLGHAEYASSDPEAGANLDAPPSEVTITFDGELDPASGFVVTDAGGGEVGTGELDLDVAERNVLSGTVSISEPGVYTVTFSAGSVDGHVEEGSFSFGYRADVPADEHGDGHDAEEGAPDTAVPAPTPSPVALVGAVLLAAGTTLGVRRLIQVRPEA